MSKLDIEAIGNLPSKAAFKGLVVIHDYEEGTARNDKKFIKGTVVAPTGRMGFKIWGGQLQEFFSTHKDKAKGVVFDVSGEVSIWQEQRELVLNSAEAKLDLNPIDFYPTRYDVEEVRTSFLTLLGSSLTDEGKQVVDTILTPLGDKFFREFASITIYHDNVVGGLGAHSYKVLQLIDKVWTMYPGIVDRVDKDLIYIGVSLHDLGKALEYANGRISEVGKMLSHRTLANEITAHAKERIVGLKGEEWYYRLQSIFAQHHGEYEEKPRTFEAMICHIVDGMEAQMTDVEQALMNNKPGDTVRFRGFYLS